MTKLPPIELDRRTPEPEEQQPPDPRAIIDELRRRLRIEQEKSLNAHDAVLGARAMAAQAKAETQEVFHRLHVRETELNQLKELLTDRRAAPRTDGRGTDDGGPSSVRAVRHLASSVRDLVSGP